VASARGSTPRTKSDRPLADRAASPARSGGRPSLTASAELGERILDAATHLFLTHGYGATSIEAVARRARVSKRTLYHRFENKPALFGAVVHRIIDRLRPPAGVPLLQGAHLEAILRGLATLILRAALSPSAIALHRLIVAESTRFPQLAAVVAAEGSTAEAIGLIAGLLERETRAGNIALKDPTFAAQQFLYMVIALPQRRAMGLGPSMTPGEVEAWGRDVVDLFLNGCRGASRAAR
jgi:AcrR family transcriptional regulator